MRRGFLNNPRAKRARTVPQATPDHAGAEPQSTGDAAPPPTPSHPAQPEVLDLHKPPPSLKVWDDRKRYIFRHWPRDPNGGNLLVTPVQGKKTSNGIEHWGATLYDFFSVNRFPECFGLVTFTSGSRLAAGVRQIGELDWAQDEIKWADKEKEPFQVFPCDVGTLICDTEFHRSKFDVAEPKDEQFAGESTAEETSASSENSQLDPSLHPLAAILKAPMLQQHIPYHLLPRKLVVHDFGKVLSVKHYRTTSNELRDVVRTYNLQLSYEAEKSIEREKARMEKEAKQQYCITIGLLPKFSGGEPLIIVAECPPKPDLPSSIPEAHLYLRPSARCGEGNHSVVYEAEWKLPRSLFITDKLCEICLLDILRKKLTEMEQCGELTLHGGLLAYDVEIFGLTPAASYLEKKIPGDSSPTSSTSKPDSAYSSLIFKPGVTAELVRHRDNAPEADNEANTNKASGEKGKDKEDAIKKCFTVAEPALYRKFEGPFIKMKLPGVHWQNPEWAPYCSHLQPPYQVPLTSKVTVVAKLSLQYDSHLAKEAINYQSFPSHFYEHWDGYNLLRPLLDPFPVGALVPQFYGYYVPDSNDDEMDTNESLPEYLSPILLIEDCGVPIQAEHLNIDDRHECASLLFRFHEAGWTHGSFAERNVLQQRGPLSEWPVFRSHNVPSFRLIDFGRSERSGTGQRYEESGAVGLLRILHHRNS